MRAEEQKRIITTIAFYAAIGGLIYFILRYAVAWFLPLVLGVAVAALMRPTTLFLQKKMHFREKSAAICSVILFYLGAAAVLCLFLTIVLAQAYELLIQLPALYSDNVIPLLERLGGWVHGLAQRFNPETGVGLERFSNAVYDMVRQAAVNGSSHLVSWAAGLAAKLPLLLLAAVFTIALSLLISTNYRAVGAFFRQLIPHKYADRVMGLQRFLRETVWRLARAYIIIMAVTFLELSAGLWLLQFDYVLPVAAAITLLDILPLIGSGTILVPWGIVLLCGGDIVGGVGILLLFGVIELIRNIIEPRIVGNQIGLHPIVTITAMYAGLRIAGVVGLLLSPIAVLLVRYFWKGS